MGWLNDWDEAAKHPSRALAFLFGCGLLGGAAIGYFRFERSPEWAALLGFMVAAILTYVGSRLMHDSASVRRQRSRRATLGQAMLFGVLLVAFIVGVIAHSEDAFVVAFGVGLTLVVIVRTTVLRDRG